MDKENKEEVKNETFKELVCRLYSDGHFETGVNTGLTYDEAVRMILELELYCCSNLGTHPLLLQASLHNILLEHLFTELPKENDEQQDDDKTLVA